MRESIGNTWTFQIIIIFILIFSAFLALVITYSKAYTVKNDILSTVEKNEGITKDSIKIINNYLSQKGYKEKGECPVGWYGANVYNNDYEISNGEKYNYCFTEVKEKKYIYYNIKVFYKFNLPFIGDLFTFQINGRTQEFKGNENRITKGV